MTGHLHLVPVNVFKGEPRQPEHVARHPFGKVPVLDQDGFRGRFRALSALGAAGTVVHTG